ncbi:MAG: SDR family NAD(P)-dependent oxidoreductase [Byssovorax sp.]
MTMRVLVTGASGFLGSHIAEQLAEAGHSVVALVRKSSNTKFLSSLRGLEMATGSVEDAASVRAAMKGVDAVIHSAGLVKARDEAEFNHINVEGTRNLLDAAREIAPGMRRFVFVSSLAAVGPSHDGRPVDGSGEGHPVTHYGRSKLAAERLVREAKGQLPVTVIRPPMIYGPRDNESFAFFQSVSMRFLPYLGNGKNTMSVVYAADAAGACIKAIDADVPSGNAYFVDDGHIYVWLDMLKDIEKAVGKKAFLRLSIPFPVVRGAAMLNELISKITGKAAMLTRDKLIELSAPHWVCDSSDTRRDLAWTPKVGWAEGTRLAAKWYQDNGWM